jgi:hypothetical protein
VKKPAPAKKKRQRAPKRPITIVRVMTLPSDDVEDAPGTVGWIEGGLVDEEGRWIPSPQPFQRLCIRGNQKGSHPKWDLATAEAKVVFERPNGWELVLTTGRRMIVHHILSPDN